MKHILDKKEKTIIAATGSRASSIKILYNSATGRDKALIRAGMWLWATSGMSYVSEPGIMNTAQASKYLRPYFSNIAGEEEIWVVLLDNKNKPLDVVQGNSSSMPAGANLDLRNLMKAVLNCNASGIIMAHNHPSNESQASREDVSMTTELKKLLSNIGVTLLDHIILTPNGEFTKVSFW